MNRVIICTTSGATMRLGQPVPIGGTILDANLDEHPSRFVPIREVDESDYVAYVRKFAPRFVNSLTLGPTMRYFEVVME